MRKLLILLLRLTLTIINLVVFLHILFILYKGYLFMQVKKNYVISIYEANKNDAGSKAKSDIDKILAKDGFEVIYKGFNISHSSAWTGFLP